jgi:hypothetical protein
MVHRVRLWFDRRHPWPGRLLGGFLLLLTGVAAGLVIAQYGLIVPFGTLAGLAIALLALFSPWTGLLVALLIAVLLPFGALPIDLGLTPTFLELALLGFLLGWLLPPLLRGDWRLHFALLDALAWVFAATTLFALILGLGRGVNATVLHNYAKTLLGVLSFLGVRQVVRQGKHVRRFLAVLLLAAGLAALVGLFFHALPDRTALKVLVQLGELGYPTTGRVLRYVEDDPDGLERAIGTSVDPNSYGGMLALVGAVALGELLIRFPLIDGPLRWPWPRRSEDTSSSDRDRPVLPHPILSVLLLLILVTIYLTYSRAALGGIVVGALFLAVVRYRRLWWPMLAGGVLLAVLIAGLGLGGPVVERFRQGIAFQDLANQMRLDEYANAAAIIRRYPLFGVGFGGAPDVDLSTGVSSLYLTIAEHMGLVGLVAFLAFVGAAFVHVLRRSLGDEPLSQHRVALLAGVVAALAIGLLDHYFFNLEFPHMVTLFWSALGVATLPAYPPGVPRSEPA